MRAFAEATSISSRHGCSSPVREVQRGCSREIVEVRLFLSKAGPIAEAYFTKAIEMCQAMLTQAKIALTFNVQGLIENKEGPIPFFEGDNEEPTDFNWWDPILEDVLTHVELIGPSEIPPIPDAVPPFLRIAAATAGEGPSHTEGAREDQNGSNEAANPEGLSPAVNLENSPPAAHADPIVVSEGD